MTTGNKFEFFSSFEISLEDFNVFAAAMLLLHNDIFKIKKSCVSNKRFSEVFHCYFNHTLLAEDGKLLKDTTMSLLPDFDNHSRLFSMKPRVTAFLYSHKFLRVMNGIIFVNRPRNTRWRRNSASISFIEVVGTWARPKSF